MCEVKKKITNIEVKEDANGALTFIIQLEDGSFKQRIVHGFLRGSSESDLITKSAVKSAIEGLNAER